MLQNISLDGYFSFPFFFHFFLQQELVADISLSVTKLFAAQCILKSVKALCA